MTDLVLRQYIDRDGVERHTWLPEGAIVTPDEGIPADMFDHIRILFSDAPESFLIRFFQELTTRNLIVPRDYLQNDAPQRINQALQATLKHDGFSIMSEARRLINGN